MTPDAVKQQARRKTLVLPYWVREFALIRTAVLTLTAAVVISATGVFVTGQNTHQLTAQMEQLQRVRDIAYASFSHVEQEKRDIRRFQPRYLQLQRRGMVGAERRLEWVDSLRQAQNTLQLPPLSYDIDPQQPVRLESALDLGSMQLNASRMRLHMELMEELDLFNFLDQLHQRGYFAVQDCSIKRLARTAGATGTSGATGAPTLGADCTLQWLTLARASSSPRGRP